MSTEVTLTVNDAGSTPACTANAVASNGADVFDFTTSDPAIATVSAVTGAKAVVTGVKDPSGPSTRTATITATIPAGAPGAGASASGVATVITTADDVTVTFNFETA